MRESQMKKIIAVAVASAFAVPAFAADVSVSGDVEYYYTSSDSTTVGSTGDQDVTVTGSESFDDGTTVTASIELDDGEVDSVLTIAMPMATVEIGEDVGTAVAKYDELSDAAEQGGIGSATAVGQTGVGIRVTPNTGIDGLALTLGFADDTDNAGKTITGYTAKYSMGNMSLTVGSTDQEDTDNEEGFVGLTAGFGPISLAYSQFSNYDFTAEEDLEVVGLTYNYGPGNVFIETGEREDSAGATHEETAYGISYKMYNVNMYIVAEDEKDAAVTGTSATDVSKTIVGVEYAF
jgi:hypothetical protein